MYRVIVNSSNIRSVGYDAPAMVLEVEFLSGDVYQYLNFPSNLHQAFMVSSSKGQFMDDYIKYNYRYQKVR